MRSPCQTSQLPAVPTRPQVEVRKYGEGESSSSGGADASAGAMVRACVAKLPPGYARVEVDALQDDQIWGLDAWDT